MGEKVNALFTIWIICSIILIFTVADLIKSDHIYSETENRVLASKPEFSKEKVLSGKYAQGYEEYVTDQFVGRDKWVGIKTGLDVLLQKKDINGVYLGKDGYLIEQHRPEDFSPEQEEKRLSLLKALVEEWNATVMLVPTADNILTDKLPANAAYFDQTAFLERVKKEIGEDNYVDVYSALKEHAGEDIYYRTDHHWTSLGAYYGYHAWVKATGRLPYHYATDKMQTVTEEFLGTLYSKVKLPVQADAIRIFPETNKREISVTYDFQKTTQSYYEDSYLNTKNKYGYFLDDNHGFVEIQTGYAKKDTLFVIKDSYANSLIPLLAPHYKTIYVVDLRYFNGRLFSFMERYLPQESMAVQEVNETEAGVAGVSAISNDASYGNMDVLVLYNCVHFLEDFQYYK